VGVCSGAACYARIGDRLRSGEERARRLARDATRDHKARAPKRVTAGVAAVKGGLDKAIVRRIIRKHLNEVRYCYQKELQGDPSLGGRVIVGFTIGPQGTVMASRIHSSTVGSAAVDQCIAAAARRWTFPRPTGGGIVVVSYPFVLRSAGQ
jgi:TonB family protein